MLGLVKAAKLNPRVNIWLAKGIHFLRIKELLLAKKLLLKLKLLLSVQVVHNLALGTVRTVKLWLLALVDICQAILLLV